MQLYNKTRNMLPDYIRKTYHRNLLEKLLKENSYLIKAKILDIGSKNRRYDHLFQGRVTAADIIPNKELSVERENVANLSYRDSSFDSVICLEVFEYLKLEDITKTILEIYRVLKKNGIAIITYPFYYRDHKDNLRISLNYITKILNSLDFKNCKIYKIGNKYTAIFDILRYSFRSRLDESGRTKKFLYALYYIPRLTFRFWTIKIFNLEKIEDDFYSGLFIILRK